MLAKPKKALIKNINGTVNTNFLRSQLEKKLLQELGEEMAIIVSNADN